MERIEELRKKYEEFKARNLKLDMSRGKPSREQLNISMALMDVLNSSTDLKDEDGVDCRNYGVLDGIPECKRLKEEEQKLLGWSAKRELSKINYHIHTDAVRANLVPDKVDAYHSSLIYAEEADVLNVALFGITAKEWREANPDKKGNMRDYATINQLICLSNMENLNAVFINEGIPQRDRLHKLNKIAIQQMTVLEEVGNRKLLK